MVIAVSFCCETKYKPQRGHEAVANFPENTLSKLTALIGLMLTTMTATANEESARPPSSREIIQQTLTCLAPSNCVNSFSSYGLEALVFDVDVRRRVVVVPHAHDDPEEDGNGWHGGLFTSPNYPSTPSPG